MSFFYSEEPSKGSSVAKVALLVFFACLPLFAGQALASAGDFSLAMEEITRKLSSSPEGVVIAVDGDQIYLNLGEREGVTKGAVFEVIRPGAPINHGGKTYRKESVVGQVAVERVRPEMSIAKARTSQVNPMEGDSVYLQRERLRRIAVSEFLYQGEFNSLTHNICERLSILLSQRGYSLVERSLLEKVLREQKLSMSGLLDISSVKKMGKLLGAEAVLVGNVSDMGNRVSINARMLDVEKGQVLAASFVELGKTSLILAMLDSEPGNSNAQESLAPVDGGPVSYLNATSQSQRLPTYEDHVWTIQVLSLRKVAGNLVAKVGLRNKLDRVVRAELEHSRDECVGTYLLDQAGDCYPTKETPLTYPNDFYPDLIRAFNLTFEDVERFEGKYTLAFHLTVHEGIDLEIVFRNIVLQ